jgi:hypothetical protein
MQSSVLAIYLRSPSPRSGYLNHSVYHLSRDVELERFKCAWQAVVSARAILRTIFVLVDVSQSSAFAQVILDHHQVVWVDRRGDDVNSLVDEHLEAVPWRLALNRPMVVVAILGNHDGSDIRFVLSIHHALFGVFFLSDWTIVLSDKKDIHPLRW